jgi:hypothetical protein
MRRPLVDLIRVSAPVSTGRWAGEAALLTLKFHVLNP